MTKKKRVKNNNLDKKIKNFVTLYISLNQTFDKFTKFFYNSEFSFEVIITNKPCFTIITGNFRARWREK